MTTSIKLALTDAEWMSLIDGSDEREGLTRCCANISALRDCLISAAREGGEVHLFLRRELETTIGWVIDGHDIDDIPALAKVIEQLGVERPTHTASTRPEVL